MQRGSACQAARLFIGLPSGLETIRLTGLEWHAALGGDRAPLKSPQRAGVAIGKIANGFWAVDVARAGTYRLALRRCPDDGGVADKPIRETFIHAVKARLQILDRDNDRSIYDAPLPVAADTTQVTFEAKLPAGQTKMMAWFIDAQGKQCGSYYVYVTRIDKQP